MSSVLGSLIGRRVNLDTKPAKEGGKEEKKEEVKKKENVEKKSAMKKPESNRSSTRNSRVQTPNDSDDEDHDDNNLEERLDEMMEALSKMSTVGSNEERLDELRTKIQGMEDEEILKLLKNYLSIPIDGSTPDKTKWDNSYKNSRSSISFNLKHKNQKDLVKTYPFLKKQNWTNVGIVCSVVYDRIFDEMQEEENKIKLASWHYCYGIYAHADQDKIYDYILENFNKIIKAVRTCLNSFKFKLDMAKTLDENKAKFADKLKSLDVVIWDALNEEIESFENHRFCGIRMVTKMPGFYNNNADNHDQVVLLANHIYVNVQTTFMDSKDVPAVWSLSNQLNVDAYFVLESIIRFVQRMCIKHKNGTMDRRGAVKQAYIGTVDKALDPSAKVKKVSMEDIEAAEKVDEKNKELKIVSRKKTKAKTESLEGEAKDIG